MPDHHCSNNVYTRVNVYVVTVIDSRRLSSRNRNKLTIPENIKYLLYRIFKSNDISSLSILYNQFSNLILIDSKVYKIFSTIRIDPWEKKKVGGGKKKKKKNARPMKYAYKRTRGGTKVAEADC